MKSLFVLPWAAVLLLSAGAAHGQAAQSAGRATLEQNANESVQDVTDMPYNEIAPAARTPSGALTRVSYGGTPEVQGEAGSPVSPPCVAGVQCDIFHGH